MAPNDKVSNSNGVKVSFNTETKHYKKISYLSRSKYTSLRSFLFI